ncbi:NB-ARC domain-containing protein [Pseudonocardia sp.]|uniref:NB-ARC domain-containing protein n=1 Tax=Pseudonocardia sp. TaxID=60912 RepID=UPI0031FBBA82
MTVLVGAGNVVLVKEFRRVARRLRWLWIVLGLVGIVLVAVRVPVVYRLVDEFFSADVQTRAQLSGPYSLLVGIASLLLSTLSFVLAWIRQAGSTVEVWTGPMVAPEPGLGSLAVPMAMSAEEVRGRGELVDELLGMYRRRARHRLRIRVLYGTADGGKTTVAQQVALQAQQRHVDVWWISAAEQTDLQTGIRLLARRLGATTQEFDREWADNAPDVLWRRLTVHDKQWLLVIDNADDTRLLAPPGEPVAHQRGWVRPITTRRGAVLITSRDNSEATWGDWSQLHEVPLLSPADGAQVLFDHAGHHAGTQTEAEDLSVRLGNLPLALTRVGRYLADANQLRLPNSITTFTSYRDALNAGGLAAVFPDWSGQLSIAEARQIVARTWDLSLELLDERGQPLARTLLRLLAVLADAPIPYQQLLDPELLAASPLFGAIDAVQVRGLLHGLSSFGLLEPTAGTDAGTASVDSTVVIRLHPLVRDTSLHHLTTTGRLQPSAKLAARLLARACSANDPYDPATWPAWQLLAPHPLHLLTSEARTPRPDLQTVADAADAAVRACQFLRHRGLFPTALAQGRMIHDTAIPILDAEHRTMLMARSDIASCYGAAGDAEAAHDQLTELLPIQRRVLGADHPGTLATRHSPRRIHRPSGRRASGPRPAHRAPAHPAAGPGPRPPRHPDHPPQPRLLERSVLTGWSPWLTGSAGRSVPGATCWDGSSSRRHLATRTDSSRPAAM